uniref:39S ribosomal protein L52, mitochondrial n=1 Tax=Panagrellus redivivus TaxID=6233 RepID=A0A7E4ZXF8_PANRE
MLKTCTTIARSRSTTALAFSRAESAAVSEGSPVPRTQGRAQFWQNPVYVGPYVNPLLKGADYSVVDGPKPIANTFTEAKRLNEQYNIGKQIVQALNELKTAEQLYAAKLAQDEQIAAEQTKWTPKAKATKEVY